MIEIVNRWDGSVLYTAKNASDVREAVTEAVSRGANLRDANLGGANLRDANLRGANLRDANLRDANLRDANLGGANLRDANLRDANLRDAYLRGANLRDANLRDANLRDAYLRGANLRGANLRGAVGITPERVNDLLILNDQVGKVRAYKLVDADLKSPIQSTGRITYEIGTTVSAKADTDPESQCGAGINLATLPWCLRNHEPGRRILLMEFSAKDIAAIPVGDGKFRVSKAKVIRELDLDALFAAEKEANEKAEADWLARHPEHAEGAK
jgi:hypothetical protein